MEPLLRRIEALNDVGGYNRSEEYADRGEYTATFLLPDGGERAVLVSVAGLDVLAPPANSIPGWSSDSQSFQAFLAAVRAMHQARLPVGQSRPSLLDVAGGWDVSLGNVVLSAQGVPSCVSHGDLETTDGVNFECVGCGARAIYTIPAESAG